MRHQLLHDVFTCIFFFTYVCVRSGRYDAFEGLRAEECGILNGCENGRCVRVREGYTCDCFDGYEFDLSKMACIGGDFLFLPSIFYVFLDRPSACTLCDPSEKIRSGTS